MNIFSPRIGPQARLQTDGFSGKNKYTGVFNCLSQTFKEERVSLVLV